MALRGWRLFGVAGTIFVYLAGILLLSFMSLNGPPQRHSSYRNGRYDFDALRHHEVVAKRQPLQWCQPLRFFGETDAAAQQQPPSDATQRPKQTFRGHFVKVRTHKPPIGARPPYHRAPPPAVSFPDAKASSMHMSISASVVEAPDAVRLEATAGATVTTTTTTEASGPHRKSKYHAGDEVNVVVPHKRNPKTAKAHQKSIKQLSDSTERNLIALASFPGSGNTWLRYLLQQATGIYTGSVYKDFGLLKSGFPAENVFNSSVLVVKTHEWGPKSYQHFAKAILLVRDPDKAILAEFNRQSGGHVGFAAPDRYKRTKGRYWQQFVTNKLATWQEMNTHWARNYTGDLLIVYYDDLIADVEGTLRSVLNFIRFPINEDLLTCAILRKEGIYRRKKRILTFDPFTTEMHTALEIGKRHVYSELGRYKF